MSSTNKSQKPGGQKFEIDIDLYFWMIDRGDIVDDQRNQVDAQNQRVKLYREHGQRLENGLYIGKIMMVLRKTIIKKSKKPFNLDPVLANLKDQALPAARQYNWNVLFAELKKFNIKHTKEQKTQILEEVRHSLIIDVLKKLQVYDTNLQAYQAISSNQSALAAEYPQSGFSEQYAPQSGRRQPLQSNSINKYGSTLALRKQADANSEINYGDFGNENGIIGKRTRPLDAESQAGGNKNFGNLVNDGRSEDGFPSVSHIRNQSKIVQNSKSSNILLTAPSKKQLLDPIGSGLESTNANEFSQYAGVVSPGTLAGEKSGDAAYKKPIIQLHQMQLVDDTELERTLGFDNNGAAFDPLGLAFDTFDNGLSPRGDSEGELSDTDTAVLFIFASLRLGFGLKQNQVGGLLATKNKFLILTCIKGTKGADYAGVIRWYTVLLNNIGHLIFLLQSELDQVFPTLNVLKCGMFSRDSDVSNLSCRVFTKIASIMNENSQDGGIIELKHSFWEWLTVQQKALTRAPVATNSPPRYTKSARKSQDGELEQFHSEAGLQSFLRAHNKHQGEFIEQFAAFMIQAGVNNYIDLFTQHLRVQSASAVAYMGTLQDLYGIYSRTQQGQTAFVDSGVLSFAIDLGLQHANSGAMPGQSFTADQGFNSSYAPGGSPDQLAERSQGLVLLVDIWKAKPDVIQARQNNNRMTDAIMQALKKGCRDRSRVISILSVNLMATLLETFGRERNPYAPFILKAMTFILIEQYLNADLKEEMLHNFIQLFKTQPTIPLRILCEPLLKQIAINLEKKDFLEGHTTSLLQPTSDQFSVNTTDFQFFTAIAVHPKLDATIAVQLLGIVSEVSRKNIIFTRISLKLLLTILARFENNTQVFEFCQGEIREILAEIQKQDVQKVNLYKRLMQNPRTKAVVARRGINQSVDAERGFSSIAGKDTQNLKYKTRELGNPFQVAGAPLQSLDKSKGIVAGLAYGEYLDDSDIQAALSPAIHQEESSDYMQMRTKEKMIVNQLQCFVNTGIKVLVDFTRQQLLDQYIRTEKKLKFKNRGILYLLQLFNKDVAKMIQFHHAEQGKVRAERVRQKKLLRDQDLAVGGDTRATFENTYADYDERDGPPLQTSIRGSLAEHYGAERSLERDDTSLFDIAPRQGVSLTIKKHNPKQRSIRLQSQLARQGSQALAGDAAMDLLDSYEDNGLADAYQLDSIVRPRRVRNTSVQGSEGRRYYDGTVRNVAPPIRALSIGRSLAREQIRLYDPSDFDGEGPKYVLWVKGHLKLYKAMFHKYANVAKNKGGNQKTTFDDLKASRNYVNLLEVFTFLNDFKIPQRFPQVRRDDVKNLIKYINLKKQTQSRNAAELDLEGFIELVLQLGYLMGDQGEKASIFMPLMFRYLKEVSLDSSSPLFQRLFQDPQATSLGDPALLKELARKVNANPDYQLPPGFVKFRTEVMVESYEPPSHLKQSQRVVLGVLDDLVTSIFGAHYLQPDVYYQQAWGVKPDVFQKQKKRTLKPQYMKIDERHTFKGRNQALDLDEFSEKRTPGIDVKSALRSGFPTGPRDSLGRNPGPTPRAKPKRFMEMESTLEPELDLALKVVLAQNLLNPNRANLKVAAHVMDDMLAALAAGEPDIPPFVTYHNLAPDERGHRAEGAPGNKAQAAKLEETSALLLRDQERDARFHERSALVKKKMEYYKKEKQVKALNGQSALREEKERQERLRQKKESEKKKYYKQIQNDFIQDRLPALQSQLQDTQAQEAQLRKKKREDKERGLEFIDDKKQELLTKFSLQSKEREAFALKQKREEERSRRKRDERNRELYTLHAQKSLTRNGSQPSISDTGSLSPGRVHQYQTLLDGSQKRLQGTRSSLATGSKADPRHSTIQSNAKQITSIQRQQTNQSQINKQERAPQQLPQINQKLSKSTNEPLSRNANQPGKSTSTISKQKTNQVQQLATVQEQPSKIRKSAQISQSAAKISTDKSGKDLTKEQKQQRIDQLKAGFKNDQLNKSPSRQSVTNKSQSKRR